MSVINISYLNGFRKQKYNIKSKLNVFDPMSTTGAKIQTGGIVYPRIILKRIELRD
jgi:hypothetical protein